MLPRRLLAAALVIFASVPVAQAGQEWTAVMRADEGFTIQGPGDMLTNPSQPGHFLWRSGATSFMLQVDELDDSIKDAIKQKNAAFQARMLGIMRDTTVSTLKGTTRDTSSVPFDGHAAVMFTFDGLLEGKPFIATQRVVFANDRMYSLIVIGPKAGSKQADADRFHGSFALVPIATTAATATAGWQPVTFTDAVCGKIPPVPIKFEMPSGFAARSAGGKSTEAGCLWGLKPDLDRVTADPGQGDFTSLHDGVFRLRMSTNVVNSPETGVFDGMDGSGEAGIRRGFEQSGARISVWKKQTLGGLPALQIIVDVAGSRVYMLYLGNTKFISNTMLVNYYPPTKRSKADDEVWAHFVAAVTK